MPGIDLNAFKAIANGTHNVGEIRLSGDGQFLEKVNNHVYQTSKNNVQLTSQENRKVREALYTALLNESSVKGSKQKKCELAQLLFNDYGNDALERDFVKALLKIVQDDKGSILDQGREVAKSLAKRSIKVSNDYTTSRREAAYTKSASEEFDAALKDSHDKFAAFCKIRTDPTEAPKCITFAKGKVVKDEDIPLYLKMKPDPWHVGKEFLDSIAKAVKSDRRLSEDAQVRLKKELSELKEKINSSSPTDNSRITSYQVSDICWQLYTNISKIFKTIAGDKIALDYRQRLFDEVIQPSSEDRPKFTPIMNGSDSSLGETADTAMKRFRQIRSSFLATLNNRIIHTMMPNASRLTFNGFNQLNTHNFNMFLDEFQKKFDEAMTSSSDPKILKKKSSDVIKEFGHKFLDFLSEEVSEAFKRFPQHEHAVDSFLLLQGLPQLKIGEGEDRI